MDPELKEIPPNEDVKKKKKKNKNKKKKNKNKENVQDVEETNARPEPQQQAQTQNAKPAAKLPQHTVKFAEDQAIPSYSINNKATTIPLDTKIPNFNFDDGDGEEGAEKAAPAAEENDSEDEGIDDYKLGGYHPVHIGEVLLERYVVIQKLGWGHFSTVWLCKDFKYDTYVAIKIQKSAPHYLEAAYDEVEILQRVAKNTSNPEWLRSLKEYYKDEGRTKFTKDDCHVVQLLNSFIYQGPYGNHFCMVFEIMGVNLLEVIKRYNYRGVPMPLCRRMAKQILIGLDYLHRMCGVIHTDLKPENILICLTKQETKDIVENGQLSRTKKFEERIREYQKSHGIKVTEKKAPQPKKVQPQQPVVQQQAPVQEGDGPKGNAKNRRKKAYKKRKKQKLKREKVENEKLMAYGIDPETLDPETREKILAEIMIDEDEDDEEEREEEEKEEEPKSAAVDQEEEAAESAEPNAEGMRGPKLDDNFRIKIVDLGNACWTHHHFTSKIQTRQYRSPEVIVGLHYDTSADIWSFACTIFEMLTGDFLFEPRKGHNFGKNDDHFAQVIELVRLLPKKYIQAGKNFKKFFDKGGNLRRIQGFHYWPLKNVLTDKYQMKPAEAEAFSSFIMPMLEYYPLKRASAQECLRNPWFKMPKNFEYKMNEEEYNQMLAARQANQDNSIELEHEKYVDSEENDADDDLDLSDFDSDTDNTWYTDDHDFYGYKHLMNKSYDNGVYTGYADGIVVNELDQEANWQFKLTK